MITTAVISALVVSGFVAPEWSTPVNTLLLIALVWVTNKLNNRTKHAEQKLEKVHQDVSSAASAGMAAAEAAAHSAVAASDTARIVKEIGSVVRKTEI